jgi:hypothetical protein
MASSTAGLRPSAVRCQGRFGGACDFSFPDDGTAAKSRAGCRGVALPGCVCRMGRFVVTAGGPVCTPGPGCVVSGARIGPLRVRRVSGCSGARLERPDAEGWAGGGRFRSACRRLCRSPRPQPEARLRRPRSRRPWLRVAAAMRLDEAGRLRPELVTPRRTPAGRTPSGAGDAIERIGLETLLADSRPRSSKRTTSPGSGGRARRSAGSSRPGPLWVHNGYRLAPKPPDCGPTELTQPDSPQVPNPCRSRNFAANGDFSSDAPGREDVKAPARQ